MSESGRDWSRVCLHADMDAFFVSVELLRRPELRGRPVIVATGTDPAARGVVMAASYEARRFGVGSAMPLATARSRCPEAVLLDRDMALYRRASSRVMEVLRRFSDRLEVAGLDEAYLDLTGSPTPKARARQMKRDVQAETGLICSVGLAPNKLLAKIASDLDKPDGFCVLWPDRILELVGDRPATLIPGVGPRTAERLAGAGIRTVAELASAKDGVLESALGPRLGHELRGRARGRDERPVVVDRVRKSESRETTFAADVSDLAALRETLDRLIDSLCRGPRRRRSRGAHRDAEDPPATVPDSYPFADHRGADVRTRANRRRGPRAARELRVRCSGAAVGSWGLEPRASATRERAWLRPTPRAGHAVDLADPRWRARDRGRLGRPRGLRREKIRSCPTAIA